MAATQNILILSSNTGGGHASAAQALESSLTVLDPSRILVKITQVLEEAGGVSRQLAGVYNHLLRHHQDWMKYYYWVINHLRPNESKLLLKSTFEYGAQLIERFAPHVLVSVHPMTQHFFAYLLKTLGFQEKIPLITVVTDPYAGFWKGWACRDVQHYYVASPEAQQQLIAYGIGAERITVSGMPVHRQFQPIPTEEKRACRLALGLKPDTFTVFLNAGWVGGGNVPQIYQALTASALDIQVIFVTGHNERLLSESLKLSQQASFPVYLFGYRTDIHRLMQASDIMVSKLGGLTTFEALATQLPIIADTITPPMPQEYETLKFIERSGAGRSVRKANEIVPLIKSLLDSPKQCDMMRQAASAHGQPGASDAIARDILGRIGSPTTSGKSF